MAGLLDELARQVFAGLRQRNTSSVRPKTSAQTAYKRQSVVTPVKPTASETASVRSASESPTYTTVPIEPTDGSQNAENITQTYEKPSMTEEKKMTTENITVENVPENITPSEDMEKDDYLLKQIDEFRVKAQQLQNLLLTKESKVQELQGIVEEREVKAKELGYLLEERRRRADAVTEEVTKQIDTLLNKVSEKMDAIDASLEQGLQEGQKLTGNQIEELKNTLGTINGQQLEEIKNTLSSLSAKQAEELKETLSELNAQLDVVKSDLSEKVHSENVQCYRNIADLLKSVDEKLDKLNEIEKKVISNRNCSITILVFSILNLLGIVGLALIALGIIK